MPYKKKSALKRNMGHGGGREGVYIIFGCTAKEIQDKFINANVPPRSGSGQEAAKHRYHTTGKCI
jgi:hypothetical protein